MISTGLKISALFMILTVISTHSALASPDFEAIGIGDYPKLVNKGDQDICFEVIFANNGETLTDWLCVGIWVSTNTTFGDSDDRKLGDEYFHGTWYASGETIFPP
jgi:hypothetical protein